MFLLSDNKSGCLILIERIVYFEKKFAMSLQTYYLDNASYNISHLHERLDILTFLCGIAH